MVEQPDRFEAEPLGLLRDLGRRRHASSGSQPSYSPIQPWGTIVPIFIRQPPRHGESIPVSTEMVAEWGPVGAQQPHSILRDLAFGRLWFIQASTQIGGNMLLYALTILVFATTRSNTAVSALVMSFLIPTILLSAAAGVLVDRLDVRLALIVPNAVRTVLTLGLALAGANVALLLALNLGISLTTVVLTPAEASMIPRIVPKPQLETAMGIFNLTLQGSFAVGFAFLGPLLVTIAGPSFVLGVVTFFYAAATVTTLALPSAPPVRRSPQRAAGLPRAAPPAARGFRAIGGNREVSRPLLHLAASASLVGIIGVLGPNLAASLGLDPKNLVVVVLPLGLGVVAGVFGLRRVGTVSRRRAAEAGLVAFGLLAFAICWRPGLGEITGLPVSRSWPSWPSVRARAMRQRASRPRPRCSSTCRRRCAGGSSGSSPRSSARPASSRS